MGQIVLEGMEFFAYHGFFDEEQKIGNKYGVDIYIDADLNKAALSDNLDDTINYGIIYKIIAEQMEIKSRLLENIGHRIIDAIKLHYPNIKKINLHISKFNPPVGGVVTRSKIILEDS